MIATGTEVWVELPGGTYRGTAQEVLPAYGWSGETRYRVTGSEPVPFETICRDPVRDRESA